MAAKKTPSFEDRLRRLQEVVAALENGELPLEDSVRLYKEGLTLSRSCREQLEKARNEVRLLTEEGLEPFDAKGSLTRKGNRTRRRELFVKKLPPQNSGRWGVRAAEMPPGANRTTMRIGEKVYKAPASGTNRKVLTKGLSCVLLFPSFPCVPDPCPRCRQPPWNQRTEDTGSDGGTLSCRQDDFPPEKTAGAGPIHVALAYDSQQVKTILAERGAQVEAYLQHCLDAIPMQGRLKEAMYYSLLAGGKRLRPVLCLSTAARVRA